MTPLYVALSSRSTQIPYECTLSITAYSLNTRNVYFQVDCGAIPLGIRIDLNLRLWKKLMNYLKRFEWSKGTRKMADFNLADGSLGWNTYRHFSPLPAQVGIHPLRLYMHRDFYQHFRSACLKANKLFETRRFKESKFPIVLFAGTGTTDFPSPLHVLLPVYLNARNAKCVIQVRPMWKKKARVRNP